MDNEARAAAMDYGQAPEAVFDDLLHYVKSAGRLRQFGRGWRENPEGEDDLYGEYIEEVGLSGHELADELLEKAEEISGLYGVRLRIVIEEILEALEMGLAGLSEDDDGGGALGA